MTRTLHGAARILVKLHMQGVNGAYTDTITTSLIRNLKPKLNGDYIVGD